MCGYAPVALQQTWVTPRYPTSPQDGSAEVGESMATEPSMASLDLNRVPVNGVSPMLRSKTPWAIPSSFFPDAHNL
jgi:hypothetical protein